MNTTAGDTNAQQRVNKNRPMMGTIITFVLDVIGQQNNKKEVTRHEFNDLDKLLEVKAYVERHQLATEYFILIQSDNGQIYQDDDVFGGIKIGDRYAEEMCECGYTEWVKYDPQIADYYQHTCLNCLNKEMKGSMAINSAIDTDFSMQDDVDNNPEAYYPDA